MAVLAKDIDDLLFEFDCSQWALMSDASKADWTVVENTCGVVSTVGSPYADSDFLFTLNGVVAAEAPITITLVDGVYTIGIDLPEWQTFKGTVSANKLIVADFDLPTNGEAVFVTVRRQRYFFTDDFTIDYGDNSVNFVSGPSLNGQVCYVTAYV